MCGDLLCRFGITESNLQGLVNMIPTVLVWPVCEGVNARFGMHVPHLHEQVHTIQSLTIVAHTVVCTPAVKSLLPVTRTSMVG